jgi:hypothetical protein
VRWIGRGVAVVVWAMAASGCGMQNEASRSPAPPSRPINTLHSPSQPTSQAPTPSPPSQQLPLELPSGFPLMAGAKSAPVPDNAGMVARWTIPVVGSAAYDFYLEALPKAGFTIVGTYPAERAALIRFRAAEGRIWQFLAELVDNRTQITLQTDRP